jgi:DNA-binding NarL/FixJ family response regulator
MTLTLHKKIRIAIADDHELIRMGLIQIFEDTHDFELVTSNGLIVADGKQWLPMIGF